MRKPIATISKTSRVKELNQSLKRLQSSIVYVGIAAGSDKDTRVDGGPDNHLLGFVHEWGSPSANIPPRPFLVPGVESVKDGISQRLESAVESALKDDQKGVEDNLEIAGMEAVDGVKTYMTNADFKPLSPRTLENRHRSRNTKSKRANELEGVDVKPLINTGALRDSVDYIVKKEG